jgi:CHAT domain-containing protein
VEIVYALRRKSKAAACLEKIAAFASRALSRRYSWINIQLKIESSVCHGMAKNFDQAWRIATNVVQEAQRAKYPALHLRCLALESALHSAEGRSREAWRLDEAGLTLFWTGSFQPERGFQFYSDAELVAEQAGSWHLAMAMQKEALSFIDQAGRPDFQALAHVRLGTVMSMGGELGNAQNEFQKAYSLFGALGSPDDRKFYQASLEVELAQIELRRGLTKAARYRLEAIRPTLEEIGNFVVELPYQKACAEVERQLGHPHEEVRHLEAAVAISNRGFVTLRSAKDRWEWQREVGQVYRQLLNLGLGHGDDPKQDLADWEAYRIRAALSVTSAPGPILGNRIAMHALAQKTQSLQRSTLLSFAAFGGRVVAWVADSRGVQEFQIPTDSDALAQEIRKFYALCSDPLSPIEKVKATGSRLYKWLLAPVQQALDPSRILFIEADDSMSSITWPALFTPNGSYFGQSFTIVNTPGLVYKQPSFKTRTWTDRIVIAHPGSVVLNGARYLPLPDAEHEVEYVSHLYPSSKVIRGKDVTASELSKQLPNAPIFHFAGHAVSREYGGELIIERKDGSGDVLSASTLAKFTLKQTQLVVLSACSTGAGSGDITRDPNGLIWAFLSAGAQRVVASRWDVNSEATSNLMHSFYQALNQSRVAASAMKTAQLSLMSSPSKSHPYYWASFQVYGYMD